MPVLGLGRLAAAALLIFFVAIPRASHAEMRFEAAFPDTPMKGATVEQGAFVWSHGAGGTFLTDNSTLGPPYLAYLIRDQGWDVFAFKRTAMDQESNSETQELLRQVAQIKSRGYRKIVLAGQSDGGWISIMAAGRSSDIYAVIALAPAHYGTDRPRMTMNATALFDYLGAVTTARTMIAYFQDDPYDPGGRGPRTEEILTRHGVPHLLLDQPSGFSGHGSGQSGRFFRRFSNCWLGLVSDGPVPRQSDCERPWGETPSADIPLPADLTIAPPSGGPAAPFLGRWWGAYDIGREIMLVVTKAVGDQVDAIYAVGDLPVGNNSNGNYTRRSGRIAGDELVFEQAGSSTLRYRLRLDGRVDRLWISADGKSQLTVVLRRLPS